MWGRLLGVGVGARIAARRRGRGWEPGLAEQGGVASGPLNGPLNGPLHGPLRPQGGPLNKKSNPEIGPLSI